jgi:hypothetical protein
LKFRRVFGLTFSCICLPAFGDQVTWDFRSSGSSTTHVAVGSGFGNVRTFTDPGSGRSVRVTAWGLTGNGNTTFQAAESGRWDTGLGVCNQDEGANCSGPDMHQLDDAGQLDFMVFQFTTLMDPLEIKIDPYNTWDRDVIYFVGNAAYPLDLTGDTLADLSSVTGHNLAGPTVSDGTVGSGVRTVTLTSGLVNTLVIGGRYSIPGKAADGDVDRYKVKSLTAEFTLTTVPEPTTTVTIMLLIAGLGFVQRRRMKSNG